jgi:hypothetical protein
LYGERCGGVYCVNREREIVVSVHRRKETGTKDRAIAK